MKHLRFGYGISFFLVLGLSALWRTVPLAGVERASQDNQFVGSDQCVACHAGIANVQSTSNHSITVRRVEKLKDLGKAVPLHFSDRANGVEYRLETSTSPNRFLDLVALKDEREERLGLLWGFGAGRKGITFLGRAKNGDYGQSLLSWYRKTNSLDVTTGLEKKVKDSHDALADWMTLPQREHCFNCHVTREAEAAPETMNEKDVGIRCERCHGAGQKHIQAVTTKKRGPGLAIRNPGKLKAIEQLYFCGACHGIPPGSTAVYTISRNMADPRIVRYPAQRLVLSRCYTETPGNLNCTSCHNPHENLPQSVQYFDSKCKSCHRTQGPAPSCSAASKDCVQCHMPRATGFMTHSDFADHWIRRIISDL